MKVDARLDPGPDVAETASELEAAGYDGVWVREAQHDPFVALARACGTTSRVRLGTGVAIAFGRNPMSVAYQANDLMSYSRGRFALGLGTQVGAHIERRFGMPWSRPAARMGEFVEALRAIWRAWETGEPLRFEGDFYRHTLMTPAFSPGPNPHGTPPVLMAAVGPKMTERAGEVADGLMVHPFTTPLYLRAVTLPALDLGWERAGRSRADFEVCATVFVVTGETDEEVRKATEGLRRKLAFYGSTPAYRAVLDRQGWGDLADELHHLSRSEDPARWEQMTELVDDDVIAAFAVIAEPRALADEILRRYAGLCDRISLYALAGTRPDTLARIASDLRDSSYRR